MKYAFTPPEAYPGISRMAHMALQLAALSSRLALEERTLVAHKTGRAENVAEHSHMLAIVAPAIAEEFYPELDVHLVSRFSVIHDIVEAYVGDTATHVISEQQLQDKAIREAQGLEKLREDYAWLPKFVHLVDMYEHQQSPEARLVRIIDKWMPVLVHFADNGATLRSYTKRQELKDNFKARAATLRHQYPDFEDLIAVREELTYLASEKFFND